MKDKDNILGILLDSQTEHSKSELLNGLADTMFNMYTQYGFPPDMFMAELCKRTKLDKLQKVYLVSQYFTLFLEHRRLSGIDEKNVDKIRKSNRYNIENFIKTGEVGVY